MGLISEMKYGDNIGMLDYGTKYLTAALDKLEREKS